MPDEATKPRCPTARAQRLGLTLLGLSVLLGLSLGSTAWASSPAAPQGAQGNPQSYFLLQLGGDRVQVRYTPGSLDRAANLQARLELAARAFQQWGDQPFPLSVFVLSREEWQQARYPVPFGVPVRVGADALAVPAAGDAATVTLWNELLQGVMPAVQGTPLRGTPQEVGTMLIADLIAQLQAAEVLVDRLGLEGDAPWIRGVMAHLISLGMVQRFEPGRLRDLDTMYTVLGQRHPPGTLSPRDYETPLDLGDWLWFQAQYHRGAQTILARERRGKGAVKRMRKLRRRGDGVLRDTLLLQRYDELQTWLRTTFTTVSRRPAP